MFATDFDSERASSVDDYKLTCIQFIEDISADYKDWVDRYNLPEEENTSRKRAIDEVVKNISEWIGHYGNTIKKIDIIKDAGINKMAEHTAGFPYEFNVYIEGQSDYTHASSGKIKLNVKAKPREERKIRLAYWYKEQFVQLLSSCNSSIDNNIDFEPKDVLDEYILLDASASKPTDIISVTIATEEVSEHGGERRGLTTLIRIK